MAGPGLVKVCEGETVLDVGYLFYYLIESREPQSVQSVDPGDSLGFSQ